MARAEPKDCDSRSLYAQVGADVEGFDSFDGMILGH